MYITHCRFYLMLTFSHRVMAVLEPLKITISNFPHSEVSRVISGQCE